jgi:hypothetical protein
LDAVKLNNLILCWDILVLHCNMYMKLINTPCGKNSEFLNVNPWSILGLNPKYFPERMGSKICKLSLTLKCTAAHVARLTRVVQVVTVGI